MGDTLAAPTVKISRRKFQGRLPLGARGVGKDPARRGESEGKDGQGNHVGEVAFTAPEEAWPRGEVRKGLSVARENRPPLKSGPLGGLQPLSKLLPLRHG